MKTYKDVRDGDLLVWSEDRASRTSNALLKIVRFFTMSEYAHVGVAMWVNGELCVVEATIPKIRIVPVRSLPLHVEMPHHVWTEASRQFLMNQVGKDYSFMDCIRAYLGSVTTRDDNWQCAELFNEYARIGGLDLGNALTPSRLVRRVMTVTGAQLSMLWPPAPAMR